VVTVVEEVFNFADAYHNTARDSFLPANTVPGTRPVIIPTVKVEIGAVRYTLQHNYPLPFSFLDAFLSIFGWRHTIICYRNKLSSIPLASTDGFTCPHVFCCIPSF